MKKLSMEAYLIIFLMTSLLANAFQIYERFQHEYPRAAYISFVGVDAHGRCVTGQEYLNYDPNSKQDIVNTIRGIACFEDIKNVVLVNKWSIKNDMSDPPEVKLVKR